MYEAGETQGQKQPISYYTVEQGSENRHVHWNAELREDESQKSFRNSRSLRGDDEKAEKGNDDISEIHQEYARFESENRERNLQSQDVSQIKQSCPNKSQGNLFLLRFDE